MKSPLQDASPAAAKTTDKHGRTIDYLRISVTDVCNLRCVYCMPEDMRFRPQAKLLQDDEIIRLASLFASLGFRKIRLTGGEPTLRRRIVDLVHDLANVDGIKSLALTTNGILLDQLARPLRDAGLQRVNVSLDTLDGDKFRTLTRWGSLRDVMAGIRAAQDVGLGVKINAVVVRGVNDEEDVIALARLSRERKWQVRFIEMMPFGGLSAFQQQNVVQELELRERIAAALGPLDAENDGELDGEARVFRLRGAAGTLGFISSVSKPFCAQCNRVRLTADGRLRLCLLRDDEGDLLGPLRRGASDDELREQIRRAIYEKPWGHDLAANHFATNRTMSEIGG